MYPQLDEVVESKRKDVVGDLPEAVVFRANVLNTLHADVYAGIFSALNHTHTVISVLSTGFGGT